MTIVAVCEVIGECRDDAHSLDRISVLKCFNYLSESYAYLDEAFDWWEGLAPNYDVMHHQFKLMRRIGAIENPGPEFTNESPTFLDITSCIRHYHREVQHAKAQDDLQEHNISNDVCIIKSLCTVDK